MNSAEIAQRWLDFFEKGNRQKIFHTVVPSASLILNDPNLLLVNAGMVPFKPYFLGEVAPPYLRATSIQKCVRTLDIEEVGKTTRHASFFQMCGNFSFGDYFKEGAIALAWELLTKEQGDGGYGFDPEKLWVTVYHDDDEAADIWHHQIGVPKNKIQRRGMLDNFWSMGVPGPCGPCSEIYYDRGPQYGQDGGPIADENRYLEIWNLVFMQNLRGEGSGKEGYPILGELPEKSIDTGLGLERTAALLQGVDNIYEIDTTSIILRKASELTGVTYGSSERNDVLLRVVADHARTALMLIGDGVTPGNDGRGYVLLRMMRRVIRNMRLLGSEDPSLVELIHSSIVAMAPQYPELLDGQVRIEEVTGSEEETFLETLKSGTVIFDLASEAVKRKGGKVLGGSDVFKLHDTYGFPFDLTLEMASEAGLSIDENGFRKLMSEQRDRAKADARLKKTGHTDLSAYRLILDQVRGTDFLGYSSIKSEGEIVGILSEGVSVKEGIGEIELVLDRTPFYAQGGGQLADQGQIELENGSIFQVYDVQTPVPGLFVHRGEMILGEAKISSKVVSTIDNERRLAISRAHTATHMVHKAFREILGESATQAGSENSPGRFRFDFPSTTAISPTMLDEIEGRVNEVLLSNVEVSAQIMSQEAAKALGAMALFGEKYGEEVRVISIGEWAKELCGGTHVLASGEIGLVKILGESSIGSGVRRVDALVGRDAFSFLNNEHLLLAGISSALKVTQISDIPEKITQLVTNLKEAEKELSTFRTAKAVEQALEKNLLDLGEISFLSMHFNQGLSADDLREIALSLREKQKNVFIALSSIQHEKVIFVVASVKNAIDRGVKAGALVKNVSAILGGGGGGKDDFATGGGSKIDMIENAHQLIELEIRKVFSQ